MGFAQFGRECEIFFSSSMLILNVLFYDGDGKKNYTFEF